MSSASRIALVTGANKGIGLETTRQLAKLGITVLLGARDEARGRTAAESLQKERLDVHFLPIDVTDAKSISLAAEQITRRFGKLDILVNNAGIFTEKQGQPTSAVTQDDLRRTFDVNFFGQIAVTLALLPLLRKSDAGRIVNLSSILGSLSEHSDPKSPIYGMMTVAYNASKSALNMFTVNLAHELRDTNIKVNVAHPGWVKTDMGGDSAPMVIEDGAKTSVWLATLPVDGPTGGYFHLRERLRW